MNMMDHFKDNKEIEAAYEEALNARVLFHEELRKLNNYIMFLEYYLKTGEALNIDYIDLPGDYDDRQHD